MENIWDSDDEGQQEEENVAQNRGGDNDSEQDKPKILKRKDEKLLFLIKEQAKKIKPSVENKVYDELCDVHEKLVKFYPQVEKVFKGKETPKLYSKSLYLIQNSVKLSTDDYTKVVKKNYLHKLRKAIESQNEEIKNVIEDYEVDKSENEELDLDEKLPGGSDDEANDEEEEQIQAETQDSDDPAVRRLKWLKKEYRQGYVQQSQDTTKKDTVKKKVNASNYEKKVQQILERIEKQETMEVMSDEKIAKEYSEKVQMASQQNKSSELVERLEYLVNCVKEDKGLKLKLYILLIQTNLDFSQGNAQEIPLNLWREIYYYLLEINKLTEAIINDCDKAQAKLAEKVETGENEINLIADNAALNLFQSSIINFLEKLQLELYKSLQYTEHTSSEFMERVKDEIKFIILGLLFLNNSLVEMRTNSNIKSRISLVLLQNIYYRKTAPLNLILKNWEKQQSDIISKLGFSKQIKSYNSAEELIHLIVNEVCSKLDNKAKVKAILSEIYYNSLNDKFECANQAFNRLNILELVNLTKSDNVKMLYNRTVIQLGLSAFRQGKFELSKYYLSPLCCLGSSRLRDNLGQTNEKFDALDRDDKKKIVPYTMTINIEEIETAFYLSLVIEDLDKVLLQRLGLHDLNQNFYLKKQIDLFEKQVSFIIELITMLNRLSMAFQKTIDKRYCTQHNSFCMETSTQGILYYLMA